MKSLIATLLAALPASAAVFTFDMPGEGSAIPDNSPSGITDTRTIDVPGIIRDIMVTLQIDGGFNGDYYASLSHDSGFTVLLNRVGRTAENPEGYSDPGLNITFQHNAPSGDVHVYRETLFGNHDTALGGPLTAADAGTWAPDARNVSPLTVTDATPRTATLASIYGRDQQGEWTLFVADMNGNNSGMLVSWGVEITVVPEPAEMAVAIGAGLFAFALVRARRKQRA